MRFIVAWPIAWTLFWFGHLCSKVIDLTDDDDINSIPFWAYQKLMIASLIVSDWGDAGVWLAANRGAEE